MDIGFLSLHHSSLTLFASSYAEFNFEITTDKADLQAVTVVRYHVKLKA